MKTILILLLLLVFIESRPEFNYQLQSGTKRKLKANSTRNITGEWNPLRIHFEYLKSDFDTEYVAFFDRIFKVAATYFHRYLLVRRSEQPITFQSYYHTTFYGFEIPIELQKKKYEADYVIFVNIENTTNETYVAYCGPVIIDIQTLRPIMGLMSWNMNQTDLKSVTDEYFQDRLESAIHEIIHGLGFVQDYFNSFYDSVTGNSYSSISTFTYNNTVYLSTPRIIFQAKYHFNCSSIQGIPMEDEAGLGTAGSHFERSLFYNELMTGSTMKDSIITDFTFQFFQDTGYYRISDYEPEQFQWGENKGCEFFEQRCNGGTFPEFCSRKGDIGCSYNRGGFSQCDEDFLANTCLYYKIYSNYDCRDKNTTGLVEDPNTFQYFGSDSMCVSGSISKQAKDLVYYSCYQYSCDSNNKLTLYVDGQTFDCSKSGPVTIPNNYYGNLQCPSDANSFCKNDDECLNQCNQKGFCQKKQCICIVGYSGRGCTDICTQYRYKEQCLSECPENTYAFDNIKYCVGCPGYCETCTAFNYCTKCQAGYQLRGGFCDNFDILNLKQNFTDSGVQVTYTQSLFIKLLSFSFLIMNI